MAKFDLSDYETVEQRLTRFWAAHPEGRVLTDLVFHDERRFIVKAEIYFDREDMTPVAHGYAEEIVGASPVNRSSALENGETSAIGRALANCGFASEGKRPSRSEMDKVQRYQDEPRQPVATKVAAREYSQAEIKLIESMIAGVETSSKDDLKMMWEGYKDLLDLPINGTTLKDVIYKRVSEINDTEQAQVKLNESEQV
jgi:hypothetical protein